MKTAFSLVSASLLVVSTQAVAGSLHLDIVEEAAPPAPTLAQTTENLAHRRLNSFAEDAALVTAHSVRNFRIKNQLKADANPFVQEVHSGGTLSVAGQYLSLASQDLEPVTDIFTPNAKVIMEGVETDPVPAVFVSKQDPRFRGTFGDDGTFLTGTFYDDHTGDSIAFEPIQQGSPLVASIENSDVDEEALAKMEISEVAAPNDRRLRGLSVDQRPMEGERQLQNIGRCSDRGFDVIEVNIAVDSTYCALHSSNQGQVSANVQAVIKQASAFYEADGLCKKLKISQLEINCNRNSDPIQSFLQPALPSDVCSTGNSFLNGFVLYVRNKGWNADVNILLHGTDFTRSASIGCAYIGTVCRGSGFASGVNYMGFTTTTLSRAKLVAHEAGHIMGADHSGSTRDVMSPAVCPTCDTFGTTSANAINRAVSDGRCASLERGSGNAAPAPAPAPVCNDSSSFVGFANTRSGVISITCAQVQLYNAPSQDIICNQIPGFRGSCQRSCNVC